MAENESPTLENQTAAAAPQVAQPNIDGLITELERAGVTNTQELVGKLEASAQAGRLAQLLGEERKRSRQLEDEIKSVMAARPAAPPADDFGFDRPASQAGQIDIESVMERTVSRVLDRREQESLRRQQAIMGAWNTIQTDEDFALVQPIWEEKLKDANFVYGIQNGQINPITEYTRVVRSYYKGITKKAAETIKMLKGEGKGGVTNPPYVETGGRSQQNLVSTEGAQSIAKTVQSAREKISRQGPLGDDEMLDVLGTILRGNK